MVAEYDHQFVRIVPGEVPGHGLFGYCREVGHGVEDVCIASVDGDRAVIEVIEDGDGSNPCRSCRSTRSRTSSTTR